MSTKIYNGYRTKTATFPQFVKEANEKLYGVYSDLYADLLVNMANNIYNSNKDKEIIYPEIKNGKTSWDHIDIKNIYQTHTTVAHAAEDIMRNLRKKLDDHNRILNIDCSYVAMFSLEDNEHVYLIYYPQHESYDEVWRSLDIEEYGYWNNTDQPEHLTDEQWMQRKERWDEVMPGYNPPAKVGLSFDTVNADILPPASIHFMDERTNKFLLDKGLTKEMLHAFIPKKEKDD